MSIRPEEVTSILQQELESYKSKLKLEGVGTILQVGDGIARVYGLEDCMAGEMLEFPGGIMGLALNLETSSVGVVILGSDLGLKDGDQVKRTGKIAQVPVGKALLGRVVDALGRPIDGKGPIAAAEYRPIESAAPSVIQRQPVKEPIMTGLKAIDAMIPIGRGQRELIIGDRQTGKTAILLDAIINQKNTGVVCIYVAVGQKLSNVVAVAETLRKNGALDHTIIVSATAGEPAALQYLAPYTGCAMGEYFL